MLIREATSADIDVVAETSISRSCAKRQPEVTDFVFALEHEGVVLAVGGLKIINPTTAWVWFDLAECAAKHIFQVYRHIRDWMFELIRIHGLKRLMAAVEPDFDAAIRTASHLGFKRESVMPHFFGDKPGLLYSLLMEG